MPRYFLFLLQFFMDLKINGLNQLACLQLYLLVFLPFFNLFLGFFGLNSLKIGIKNFWQIFGQSNPTISCVKAGCLFAQIDEIKQRQRAKRLG